MDSLLWCEECGAGNRGECEEHGELFKVKDRVIPSRARLTLPHLLGVKLLELRAGGKHVYGVFARKVIQKRTQFGPLEGTKVETEPAKDETKIMFKVFSSETEGQYIDTSDENVCNWMMFLRPAKNSEEQNVVAFQFKGHIYCTTTKPIAPNAELKVWYSGDYAKLMEESVFTSPSPEKQSENEKEQEQKEVSQVTENHIADDDNDTEMLVEDDIEDEEDDTTWPCSVCGEVFLSFALFEEHTCKKKEEERKVEGGRRTKSKRKGRPKKLPHKTKSSKDKGGSKEKDASHDAPVRRSLAKGKPVRKLHHCTHCEKAFASDHKLKLHIFTHTGEKPFKCQQEKCNKAFTSKFKLMRHELVHKPTRAHECPYCDKCFNRKDHLKNHLRIHDPNKKTWKCEKCDREYNSTFTYKTHMGFHAAEDGDLQCKVCNKEFENKEKLIFHLKIHTGARSVKGIMEKKETCPYCDKRFFTKKDVKRHLVVHTRNRDFLCQVCPQRFGRRDHLMRHLRKSHPQEADDFMTIIDAKSLSGGPLSPVMNTQEEEEEETAPSITLPQVLPKPVLQQQQQQPPESILNEVSYMTSANTNHTEVPNNPEDLHSAVLNEALNNTLTVLQNTQRLIPLQALAGGFHTQQPLTVASNISTVDLSALLQNKTLPKSCAQAPQHQFMHAGINSNAGHLMPDQNQRGPGFVGRIRDQIVHHSQVTNPSEKQYIQTNQMVNKDLSMPQFVQAVGIQNDDANKAGGDFRRMLSLQGQLENDKLPEQQQMGEPVLIGYLETLKALGHHVASTSGNAMLSGTNMGGISTVASIADLQPTLPFSQGLQGFHQGYQ